MERFKVLIANDDGIDAPGLRQLAACFSREADVYVVAPEGERSSNSHHLTIKGKIRYEIREIPGVQKAFALWGTPADCVHMGLKILVGEKIDLVVSGINRGRNVSTDIIYSGTIGAAREAFLEGIPAMAVSLASFDSDDYRIASEITLQIAKAYLKQEKPDYFLNVNIPALPREEIKGFMVCDGVASILYHDRYFLEEEDGLNYIRIASDGIQSDLSGEDLRIDIQAVKNGYVSVSPLGNDHIRKPSLEKVRTMLKETEDLAK